MKDILVNTLMSRDVSALRPDAPLQQAIKQMVAQRFSCIIVVKDNKPLGIVTERDLIKVLDQDSQDIDLSVPVSDFMSSPIFSLNDSDTLFDAMVISRAHKIRHLPVINEKDLLVGLVTQTDIANAHFHITEHQAEMIEQTVAAKTLELKKLNDELQALSTEDHLMKIGNRRAMEVDLSHTHSTAVRYEQPYSVLLIDIDFFKLYNDHYGHLAGDEALQAVADVIKTHIRSSDRLYRYGGEELLIVLPNTGAAQTKTVSHKLISALEKEAIPHIKSPHKTLTVSCGGTCVLGEKGMSGSWQSLVEIADSHLYQAKNSGRNCAVVE